MARSPEQTASSQAEAMMATEVLSAGGSRTIRVAVAHTDEDHPSSVAFHYGPAFNDQMADVIAHVRGVSSGEVDLHEEALDTLERARQEYPADEGWEAWLEAIVPHEDDDDQHIIRRLEES